MILYEPKLKGEGENIWQSQISYIFFGSQHLFFYAVIKRRTMTSLSFEIIFNWLLKLCTQIT